MEVFSHQKQERLFCGVLIKFVFKVKKAIFLLTNTMSKICKKQVKLLQNSFQCVILFIQ